jgi:hypothetical protein
MVARNVEVIGDFGDRALAGSLREIGHHAQRIIGVLGELHDVSPGIPSIVVKDVSGGFFA